MSILLSVASGIIFWQSSFSADFYGQVLLVILTTGPVFGAGAFVIVALITDKFADEIGVFCLMYSFCCSFMLIPLVTLSFISGFHLDIGSFPKLLIVCFVLIPLVVSMSIVGSLGWPLAIVVYIIWRLFNPSPFPTSIGDLPVLLYMLSSISGIFFMIALSR